MAADMTTSYTEIDKQLESFVHHRPTAEHGHVEIDSQLGYDVKKRRQK